MEKLAPTAEFKPTDVMVDAAFNVFLAKAVVGTIRPIVEGYQKAILAEGQWLVRPEYAGKRGAPAVEVIDDPSRSYLMSEADFAVYDGKCKQAREDAGLFVEKEEQCPLLVAEENERVAERELIETMADLTKVTHERLFNQPNGSQKYNEYVDLTLRLLAPFVDDKRENALFSSAVMAMAEGMGLAADSRESPDVKQGKYGGTVLAVDRDLGVVFQSLGRGAWTVHRLDALGAEPEVGKVAQIGYQNGKGDVTVPERSLGNKSVR